MKIKITERGWPAHFICADRCMFRRNTLIEVGRKRVVVSTIGQMRKLNDKGIEEIGINRYYETMAFKAIKEGAYWEADILKEITFHSERAICADDWSLLPDNIDNKANGMHDEVVKEITERLKNGE